MPSTVFDTAEFLNRVRSEYATFQFVPGDQFRWSPAVNTIFYALDEPHGEWLLLHELSHALLDHKDYQRDIQLLQIERDAWDHAKRLLAPKFALYIADEFIDDHLQTYREWLYARSLCPTCSQTGLQTQKNTYSCMNCRCSWGVNDARECNLRRVRLQGRDRH